MESQFDINASDYDEIEVLKDKLNRLLGDRQNDIQRDFDHDESYYNYCDLIYKNKIKTLTELNTLKFLLPLIEASVNVNKALRKYHFQKNDSNLLNLYNAQNSLKGKIEETINNNKPNIDNVELYLLMLQTAILISVLLTITIIVTSVVMMPTLETQFPAGSYLVLSWIMSIVPSSIAFAVREYFEMTHKNEIQMYMDFNPTKKAFKSRNEEFADYFNKAEKAFKNIKTSNVSQDETYEEKETYPFSS